jgi:glycosyltransferase involved in cell wall biosynthesis
MRVGWKAGSSDPAVASYRYRVLAPMEALTRRGHDVEPFDPAKSELYDQVVFCKSYGQEDRELARRLRARGARVVFDLCDNHLYNPFDHPKYRKAREHIGEMVALADRVTCSTPTLAMIVAEAFGRGDVTVVPDAVEAHVAEPAQRTGDGPVRLLWYGSHGSPNAPSGMTDLLLIREQLERLARRRPVLLTVCSNNRSKFDERIAPLKLPTRYVDWTLESFGQVLAAADVVLLPASINPFTVCKTHNRLTTALHAGVPVVATALESYREFAPFCTLDDWEGGLWRAVDDNAAERRRALSAREVLDRAWSMAAIAPRWEQALGLRSLSAIRPSLRVVGRLDAVAETAVGGWVFAPAEPNLTLTVLLEAEGRIVARARADQVRPDLAEVGLPAACGFVLPAPPPGAAWSVRVQEADWTFAERPLRPGEACRAESSAGALIAPPPARRNRRGELVAALRARREALVQHRRAEESRGAGRAGALLLADLADAGSAATLPLPSARPALTLVRAG